MAKWIVVVSSLLPLLVVLYCRWHEAARKSDGAAEAQAFLSGPLGTMAVLPTPAAVNDHVLARIYVEVEGELLRAGHLR